MGIHGVAKIHWSGGGMTHAVTRVRYRNPTETDLSTDEAHGIVLAIATALAPIHSNLPNSITVTNDPEIVCYDNVTGMITSIVEDTSEPTSVVGTDTGVYVSGAGARVTLHTPGIVRGRRVQGALMMVPLAGGSFTTDGNIAADTATQLISIVEAFDDTGVGAEMCVWTRSKPARGTLPALDGSTSLVEGVTVDLAPGVLRRRRF